MNKFNPKSVQCPHCSKAKLKVIKINHQIIGYSCPGECDSNFDSEIIRNPENQVIFYIALRRNPEHTNRHKSLDTFKNYVETLKLEEEGVPFHSHRYVLGYSDFSDNDG